MSEIKRSVRRSERAERKENGVAMMTQRTMTARCTVWFVAALAAALITGCASVSSGGGTVAGVGKTSAPTATPSKPTATASAVAPSSTSGPAPEFWPASLDMTSATGGWALYFAQNPAGTSSPLEFVARTVDGARNWTDVTPPAARPLLAAKFATVVIDPADSEHAYLAVTAATTVSSSPPSPAAVFATADGGKTWTESAPFTVDGSISQVVFADPRHGWLLTGGGNSVTGTPLPWLYRTTDGGLHWTAVASAPPPGEGGSNDMCLQRAITFPTPTTGWVLVTCRSGDYLAQTADGGSTWSVQPLPALSACARVVNQCMLLGPELSDGTAYLTVTANQGSPTPSLLASGDLGQSWHELTVPAGSEQYPEVTFFGPDDGMLVPTASQQTYGTVFYTTTDGGQTWSPVLQGTHFTQLGATIDFATPQDGFSWTQSGDAPESTPPPIYATTDSGATWISFAPAVTG
jgi:photosystem II stability/assembly factor-like uncharacterized protein